SARGVGDLRSPGYGCLSCRTADSIPAIDKWQIKTNTSIKSDTTAEMLQTYVEQAELDNGGWIPLVFHRICAGCATNAMDLNTFRDCVDWLSKRPSTTQVKTVGAVVGGGSGPTPTPTPTPTPSPTPTPTPDPTPPPSDATSVTANGQTRALTGTNVRRTA